MLVIKKRMQLSSVLVGFGLALSLGAAMAADPVTVNVSFTGEVTASNCVVSNAGGGTISVRLDPISMDKLKSMPLTQNGQGITALGTYPLPDITLTGCPAGVKASFAASGSSTTYLSNAIGTGLATGVGVSVTGAPLGDGMGWLGASNGMPLVVQPDGAAGNYRITGLKADYVKVDNAPTAGLVRASGTLTITY